MTSSAPSSTPIQQTRATKPTIVPDANGDWIWSERPTPAQDAAWIASQHKQRDAFLSLAKTESKLSVQYRKWALEETKPERAAHYATEALRLRRNSWNSLRAARGRNV
jgi:polysaccharide pyruvyl transferase WcaK-like protein